jgi:hypothetical protein
MRYTWTGTSTSYPGLYTFTCPGSGIEGTCKDEHGVGVAWGYAASTAFAYTPTATGLVLQTKLGTSASPTYCIGETDVELKLVIIHP